MSIGLSILTFCLFGSLLVIARRLLRGRPLKDVRGPPSPSLLLGHEIQTRAQNEVGDLDFKWIREYGTAWRISGCYGEDILMVADPKAIQYIFHTSGYHYPKRPDAIQSTKLIMGRGIVAATGDVHQRHRKVMNPAFSAGQLRTFLPFFRRSASKLTQKWKEELKTAPGGEKVVNVSRWLARTTLDVVGEVAFDYRFGALEDSENELLKTFDNLFADSFLHPPKWDILFKALWRYIPSSILQYVEYLPTAEYRRFRRFLKLAKKIAKDLVSEKGAAAMDNARGARDIMSILVHSNMSEDAKRRLDDDEVLSQMATLMFAAHETTASSLSWLLMELAKHPEDQTKLREEIAAVRAQVTARGDDDFSTADFDSMTFMNATIKESMRLHPIVPALAREAGRDDVIPLSNPIETRSGQTVSEVHVHKGQNILISICGYNRLPNLWGDDANSWNPARFLENAIDKQASVGVYANLMTFSAGIRGCIGWRFALIEMHAILVELIENFEFKLSDKAEIQRVPAGLMIPMVKGRMHEGTQLPLQVSLVG